MVMTDGTTYRFVTDHLGSVRALVDATSGTVTERIDYDEWGNVTASSGAWSVQPFGFAGGLHDAATGLVRFGVRDYDPVTGRWTAKEPLGFAADTNFYAYALGDPINFIDPTGLDGWLAAANWLDRHGIDDFFAGFGDVLSFGLTNWMRSGTAAAAVVDQCSTAYAAGEWTGVAHSVLLGGAMGFRAAGSRAAGAEFSHWIPDRLLRHTGSRWLRRAFGNSRFNGNFVSQYRHAMHDTYRHFLGSAYHYRYPFVVRMLDRVPRVYYGAGAGLGYGSYGRTG